MYTESLMDDAESKRERGDGRTGTSNKKGSKKRMVEEINIQKKRPNFTYIT